MIEAKDLRLNNWVYSPIHKKNGKVVAIEIGGRPVIDMGDGLTASFSGADCLNGIALTPEVLLSCGFEKYEQATKEFPDVIYKDYRLGNFVFIIKDPEGRPPIREVEYCRLSIDDRTHICNHIFYLHQLQNLYWCLTGTELNYEPQMNPFINLFRRKEKRKLIWKGAISSSGPQQQGPITVLALRTENDKKEFDEGCIDAQIDFHNNVPMPMNLNYPFHPYARGYVETYRGLIGK